jgi:hypothetical protein
MGWGGGFRSITSEMYSFPFCMLLLLMNVVVTGIESPRSLQRFQCQQARNVAWIEELTHGHPGGWRGGGGSVDLDFFEHSLPVQTLTLKIQILFLF